MKLLCILVIASCGLLLCSATGQKAGHRGSQAFLGFDRNDYPGDANLPALRKTFSYTGYWLNAPPGETSSSWLGKRHAIQAAGLGFLVLFNGRTDAQIRANGKADELGRSDSEAAVRLAHQEGFPRGTVIFLDQEEGGRLLPEQRQYLHAWADGVTSSGFRAGVYCSGISFTEGTGEVVVTAEDIHTHAAGRPIVYWVSNDKCPPSPGCALPKEVPVPSSSGIAFADVWQYAQSPKRTSMANGCPANYNPDGNCYAPGAPASEHLYVDMNTASSADPSDGRTSKH